MQNKTLLFTECLPEELCKQSLLFWALASTHTHGAIYSFLGIVNQWLVDGITWQLPSFCTKGKYVLPQNPEFLNQRLTILDLHSLNTNGLILSLTGDLMYETIWMEINFLQYMYYRINSLFIFYQNILWISLLWWSESHENILVYFYWRICISIRLNKILFLTTLTLLFEYKWH